MHHNLILSCALRIFLIWVSMLPLAAQEQRSPVQEFTWTVGLKSLVWDSGDILLQQKIAPDKYAGVEAIASCDSCWEYGLRLNLYKIDENWWNLHAEVDSTLLVFLVEGDEDWWGPHTEVDSILLRKEVDGKTFRIVLSMIGRDGAKDSSIVRLTVKAAPELFATHKALPDSAVQKHSDSIKTLLQNVDIEGRSVNIYRVEGRFRLALFRCLEAADSIDLHTLNALGSRLCQKSVENFAEKALEALVDLDRGYHSRSIQRVKFLIAQAFRCDSSMMTDVDAVMVSHLSWTITHRHTCLPDDFYLITTQDDNPQLIAIEATRFYKEWGLGICHRWQRSYLKDFLETGAPKGSQSLYDTLTKAATDTERSANANNGLRKIWQTP